MVKRTHNILFTKAGTEIIQAFPGQHITHLESRLCGHHPGHSYGWSDLQLLNFRATMFPQVRVQTTGIIEYNFPLEFRKNLTRDCIFIDVGGQRNERKKWSGWLLRMLHIKWTEWLVIKNVILRNDLLRCH